MPGIGSPTVRLLSAALDQAHDYRTIRASAVNRIRFAMLNYPTQREAAEALGIPLRALQRLLHEHPELRAK